MKHAPVVLITGTSSGIGRAAVVGLQKKGCHVIATARNLADIKDLRGDNVEVYALDVTDDASMQRVVDEVIAEHGRIDVLVNNAGFGVMMPLEELPMDQMRHMFEVNVFGLQRLTQMVLPHMRAQDKIKGFGRGRIINVASAAGHISMPTFGAYCATKFSVRALSWALHGEVKRFGIRVSLIEPGNISTKFGVRANTETQQTGVDREGSPYAGLHRRMDMLRFNDNGLPVRIITKRIVHACIARKSRFHYLAPYDAKGAWFASRFLPDTWVSALTSWYFWTGKRSGN